MLLLRLDSSTVVVALYMNRGQLHMNLDFRFRLYCQNDNCYQQDNWIVLIIRRG